MPTTLSKAQRIVAANTVPSDGKRNAYYLYLPQKISEVIEPEAQGILFQAIANGSVVSWQQLPAGRIRPFGRKNPGFGRDQATKIGRLKAV